MGDGSYTRLLTRLAKLDLLAIDDWLLAPLKEPERRDLMEVVEDRAERASTLIASQLSIKDWHAVIGDPNQADACAIGSFIMLTASSSKDPRCARPALPPRNERDRTSEPKAKRLRTASLWTRRECPRKRRTCGTTGGQRCAPVDHTHSPLDHYSAVRAKETTARSFTTVYFYGSSRNRVGNMRP
ncbi:MAG: ATP-binding protein [Gammaproteobacteria bacterium]